MAFAKLSEGFDILGFDRKIIGFDTFTGFPNIDNNDINSRTNNELKIGGFSSFNEIENELYDCIDEFNQNRFINFYNKIELIKGDATETIPKYITENPHTLISMLFLDFDLYAPTKIALEYFAKRVVKGGVIAFDELNNEFWQGETVAALEYFKTFNKCNLQKFYFEPNISYMVIE